VRDEYFNDLWNDYAKLDSNDEMVLGKKDALEFFLEVHSLYNGKYRKLTMDEIGESSEFVVD
jgi:hypothetical protein